MADKFKQRSTQSEWLDRPGIPQKLLEQNLRELDFLNRWFGGHQISLAGLKKLATDKSRLYRLADLGCGSGDLLKYLAKWARKNGLLLKHTGIDKNPGAIAYLKKHCSGFPEIEGMVCDYKDFLNGKQPVDIIHASLFCHHLSDNELVGFFRQTNAVAKMGFIVSDLQRNRFAYYGARLLTVLLNGSKLSKNDGPLSVLRAFKQSELELLLKEAGVKNYQIQRRGFFRFLIVGGQNFNLQNGSK